MELLENTIMDYAWGSPTAIPELLRLPVTGKPQAELWIGAHPQAPSRVVEAGVGLDEYLRRNGQPPLPFLMKVLAAARPLSLQVHPSPAQAETGFAAEERAGISRDDPRRNYKDSNHKPEMILALTDFSALCGFREPAESAADVRAILQQYPSDFGTQLAQALERGDIRDAFTAILTGGPPAADFAHDVVEWAKPGHYPTGRTVNYVAETFAGDPSIAAVLLINRIDLLGGDALYLGAGIVHAYLYGLGIESMASSDNVLRGGLTPKYIDVPEVLRVLRFEPFQPELVHPAEREFGDAVQLFSYPCPQFTIHDLHIADSEQPVQVPLDGPAVILCVKGKVVVNGQVLGLGGSGYLAADEPVAVAGAGRLLVTTSSRTPHRFDAPQ
jgi:mannose-6-phosphate isomerase